MYMSFKRHGEIAIITPTINAHLYMENLKKFIILLIENSFGSEVLFPDENILSKNVGKLRISSRKVYKFNLVTSEHSRF